MNEEIKIKRVWAMPSKDTFTIKPIAELLRRYVPSKPNNWIDPFAGFHSVASITNDLNIKAPTDYHLEAVDFIKSFLLVSRNGEPAIPQFDGALFDPPYSLRQIMECYNGIGKVPDKKWVTTKFYPDVKNELAKVIKPGGLCISFGWNTIGLGKIRGFEIIEVLVVSHGRLHNDTLVTVERKIYNLPRGLAK
ncbi:MAG: adenine-specific DNA methylase [Thermoplasmata archaeon]